MIKKPVKWGLGIGAGKCGQHIEWNGEKLKRKEHNDQVSGLGHQHHAWDAENKQGVIFAALNAHAACIPEGQRNSQQPTGEKQHIGKGWKTVNQHHAAKACIIEADLGDGQAKRDGKTQSSKKSCGSGDGDFDRN